MASTTAAGAHGTSWTWWGAAAGALGLAANLLGDDQAGLTAEQRQGGAAVVVPELERVTYHVGVAAGMLAVACLLLAAAGWRRWAEGRLDLAARAIPTALAASAAALLVGYGFRGGLAEYLPGGINEDNFAPEGLYVLFMINDTAPFFGWWGVVFAAAFCAWLAFAARALPLWLGVLSAVAVLVPAAVLALTGAVALAGVVGPAWLALASAGLAVRGLVNRRA